MAASRSVAGDSMAHRRLCYSAAPGTDDRAHPAPLALPDLGTPQEHSPTCTQAGQGRQGGKHPRNTLNELSGDEWLFFTKSVLSTAYPSGFGHRLRKAHGANKPPQLMKDLIEFFTPPGGGCWTPSPASAGR